MMRTGSARHPLTVHIMTAAMSLGDAIGNYILALVPILREWGCEVMLYADHPNARFPLPHFHTSVYKPTGRDILWFHYSIYTDNIHWLRDSTDFVVFDSHNVSPAHLFHGYDPHMEWLCREGERLLGTFVYNVDLVVVHTDYVREDLQRRGYHPIYKVPLVVDTARFTGTDSPVWAPLLQHLPYLLFVGRIVPQKDVAAMLRVFAALKQRRPDVKLFLVGSHSLPSYIREMRALAAELGIDEDVLFTGPVTEPDILTSFYRYARFYLALSEWESFCVPIVESMYFGTPVVGHAVPPIPETMGGGGVVLRGSADAMGVQIDDLWDDEESYGLLQEHGRAHTQRFTDVQLRHALLDVFRAIAVGR
jgi:glycosyltransferase involved in cell wall biosynthesis